MLLLTVSGQGVMSVKQYKSDSPSAFKIYSIHMDSAYQGYAQHSANQHLERLH